MNPPYYWISKEDDIISISKFIFHTIKLINYFTIGYFVGISLGLTRLVV